MISLCIFFRQSIVHINAFIMLERSKACFSLYRVLLKKGQGLALLFYTIAFYIFKHRIIYVRITLQQNSTTLYGIVVYHAADCLPGPCTETFGPYANPHKLLLVLDKLE